MGERHARTYSKLNGCLLAGVYDPDLARAAVVTEQYGGTIFRSMEGLVQAVDAVSIVSPTVTHAATAIYALERGLHVLIEKPMTASVDEGRALAQRARTTHSVALVGHIERFNPVIHELSRLIRGKRVRRARMQRMSPFPQRSLDTDVISDVMIHDIDLVQYLFGTRIRSIVARGDAVLTDRIDRAVADLELDGGPTVTLVASRVADLRTREVEVVLDSATITADLLGGSITVTSAADVSGKCVTETRAARRVEPLQLELRHFLNCIREREKPLIDADAGLRAVEWAEQIVVAISEATSLSTASGSRTSTTTQAVQA
jgi:predicted dehydrogenase